MSDKIDSAIKELIKALRKHANTADSGANSSKRVQRAIARVTAAASEYAEAVHAKAGMENPFADVVASGLEKSTLLSLEAERNQLAEMLKPST